MESIRWRYQPEFRISVTLNGQLMHAGIRLSPSAYSRVTMENYCVLSTPTGGHLVCSVKQRYEGINWVPAIPLTSPVVFAFVVRLTGDVPFPELDFFGQGSAVFGRRIFYANNLSAAGAIDSNLAGNAVRLTPAADVAQTDAGSICGDITGVQVMPGAFTQFRLGRIRSGAPVAFTHTHIVAASENRVSLDMSAYPRGSYLMRLEGSTPVQERVCIDPVSAGQDLVGVIEIFRDIWHVPAQPRNYTVNFTS